MDSKLNSPSIESYSTQYAKKICDNFFATNSIIEGNQILKLCKVEQINYFILKNLFFNWKKEIDNFLKSPYFNYEDAEVKDAFVRFKNILSKHISISREHLEPLVKMSVRESILLIFSPYDYYNKEVVMTDNFTLTLSNLKEFQKYIKVNGNLLKAFIELIETSNVQTLSVEEAQKLFNQACENTKETPEDVDKYIDSFSQELSLTMNAIYTDSAEEKAKEKVEGQEVNDKFVREESALNENFSTFQLSSTVADVLKTQKIDSINKHISLNQRFMFVNQLFEGEKDQFYKTIESLERCNSYKEAIDYLTLNVIKKNSWNMESVSAKEFLEILERRFGQ